MPDSAERPTPDGVTLGVEEEFLLLDADTLLPAPRARDVLARVTRSAPTTLSTFQQELCTSEIEAATTVCTTLSELGEKIHSGRSSLARGAAGEHAHLVSVGEPVTRAPEPGITATDHYLRMRERYTGAVTDLELCGCHVHVGVHDLETRVAVLNHLTPWLPTLLALTTNSRYRYGADSGFHSWRMMAHTRLPAAGMPLFHADAASYYAVLDRLVDCGMLDEGQGGLRVARLSSRFPTVEVRVGDAAATVGEAVLYAGLTRALVRTALTDLAAGRTAQRFDHWLLNCALWAAARHGLAGEAVDPWQQRAVPASAMLDALLLHVRDALDESGDTAVIQSLVAGLRERGTGSTRQVAAAASGGLPAVLSLLIEQTVADVPESLSGSGRPPRRPSA